MRPEGELVRLRGAEAGMARLGREDRQPALDRHEGGGAEPGARSDDDAGALPGPGGADRREVAADLVEGDDAGGDRRIVVDEGDPLEVEGGADRRRVDRPIRVGEPDRRTSSTRFATAMMAERGASPR